MLYEVITNAILLAGQVSLLHHWGLDAEGALDAESASAHIASAIAEARPFRCVLVAESLLLNDVTGQPLLPLEAMKISGGTLVRCLPVGIRSEARPLEGVSALVLHKPLRRLALRKALIEAFCDVALV